MMSAICMASLQDWVVIRYTTCIVNLAKGWREARMPARSYTSSVRTAAAAEKRERVIEAAARSLREDASIASFSLDTVAKAAGVTRLTVYNQFGSRRGFLEAGVDDIARQGGRTGIADAGGVLDLRGAPDWLVVNFFAVLNLHAALCRLYY